MTSNLANDYVNILGLIAVFYMVDYLITDKDRRDIGTAILAVLIKDKQDENTLDISILQANKIFFDKIFTTKFNVLRVTLFYFLIFNSVLIIGLMLFSSEFRLSIVSIFTDKVTTVEFILTMLACFISLFIFIMLLRHIVPLLDYKFTFSRLFVFAVCSLSLWLASFVICQAVIKIPAYYAYSFRGPYIVPLEITYLPANSAILAADSKGIIHPIYRDKIIFERKVSEAEQLILANIDIQATKAPRDQLKHRGIYFDEGFTSSINDDSAYLYTKAIREIERHDNCGRNLLNLASEVLEINNYTIMLVGNDNKYVECHKPPIEKKIFATLQYSPDIVDTTLSIAPIGFSLNYNQEDLFQRGGYYTVGFIAEMRVGKTLSLNKSDIHNYEKFKELDKLLDYRQIRGFITLRQERANIILESTNLIAPQLLISIPFFCLLAVLAFTKIYPLKGTEYICTLIQEKPLHVLAMIYFLIAASLVTILNISKIL